MFRLVGCCLTNCKIRRTYGLRCYERRPDSRKLLADELAVTQENMIFRHKEKSIEKITEYRVLVRIVHLEFRRIFDTQQYLVGWTMIKYWHTPKTMFEFDCPSTEGLTYISPSNLCRKYFTYWKNKMSP